jgi:peptide/nickel transport system permease protein
VMDRLWHLLLPSIILAIGGIAALSRYTRSSMLEVIRQDYIRTAKAKGLPEETVYYKHALRNALLPIITLFGFLIPGLIGGSIIIETVFAWPGIGRLAYQAVLSRDYPVVMTINTITAVLVLIGNFVADLLYGIADPRIRYQ